MAFLIRRNRSPYFWIRYRKSSGKKSHSLRLRWDNPVDVRKAREFLRRAREEERFAPTERHHWSYWVDTFIRQNCGPHPGTIKSNLNRWKALEPFLASKKILSPQDFRATHVQEYISWRTGASQREGGVRKARRNTALGDLSLLRRLLHHAVILGFITNDPTAGLRLKRERSKEKPEIDPAHLPVICNALQHGWNHRGQHRTAPAWMWVSFQIGFHTGCRVSESLLPLKCVDLDAERIHFPTPKGGKPFTVPLPKALLPLFTELKGDARREWAFTPDCAPRTMSIRWTHFFRSIGLPNYCYHSLRVSFISHCARAGVPERIAMRLVNHASALVHQIYVRHQVSDLLPWVGASTRSLPE